MIAPLDSPMVRLLSVAALWRTGLSRTATDRSRRPSRDSPGRSGEGGRRNRRSAASGSDGPDRATPDRNRRSRRTRPSSRSHSLTAWRTRLALRVPGAGKEGLVLERGQRAADDLDSARVPAHRELLQPGDHLRGGDLFFGLAVTVPQIVGAEHDDGVGDAGLRQHVAVEAAQAAVAPDIVQDAVAAESLVHHRHRPAALPRHEPARELRGPAVMAVMGRDVGVGQRVADRDDGARLPRRDDIDAADEVPVVGEAADRHDLFGGEISRRRDVVGLPRIAPGDPEARRQIVRQVHADGKVRQRREAQLDRIADDERAGGDRRPVLATEGEPPVGARHERRARRSAGRRSRADRQRTGAVGIRDAHAQRAAADADARDHPQRVVAEGGAFGGRRGRSPGADPVASGPEPILPLLVALILAELGRLSVPQAPDVHFRERRGYAVSLRPDGAHGHRVAHGVNVVLCRRPHNGGIVARGRGRGSRPVQCGLLHRRERRPICESRGGSRDAGVSRPSSSS